MHTQYSNAVLVFDCGAVTKEFEVRFEFKVCEGAIVDLTIDWFDLTSDQWRPVPDDMITHDNLDHIIKDLLDEETLDLCSFEIAALRQLSGNSSPDPISGAALNAALEVLVGRGLITPSPIHLLTEAGHAVLAQLGGPHGQN